MCQNCTSKNGMDTKRCVESPWDSCNLCGCSAEDGIVKKNLCTTNGCPDSKW